MARRFSGGGRESLTARVLPAVFCCILCTVLASFTPTAHAQSSSPALDAVLARIEFDGTETPQTLGPDLVKLTENDLTLLCGMLVEPGTSDDTKTRMALHALTLYLADKGTPDQRDTYVDALCTALESDQPTEVKTFLIRQLQLVGDARITKLLSQYLGQDELRDPVAQALLAIGGKAGAKALLRAFESGSPETRVTILTAIRQSQARDALRRLAAEPDLGNLPYQDQELVVDLLALLAADDLPAAALTLRETLRPDRWNEQHSADDWRAQTHAISYALEIADSLVKTRHADLGTDIYRDLIQLRSLPEEVHVRCAALSGLANALGSQAVGEVVAALTDENPELRAAAMEIAVGLGGEGVTDAYVKELGGASPEVRVAILDVLARRGNQGALPAVLAAFDDVAKDVRIAAIRAAAAIGGEEVIGALAACLAGDDDERDAAADELVKLPGKGVSSDLADALADAPHRMKRALLNVLARRRATGELDTIRKYMRHESQDVRMAAINAVGDLAKDVGTVQRLLLLLANVGSEEEREAIEAALIDVCRRPDDNAEHIATVIDSIDLDNVAEYSSLLRVLGDLGGQAASEILLAAARDGRTGVVEAALRGLGSFPAPDRAMTADVLGLAMEATKTKPHVLGMRAFAELLKRTEIDVADKLGLYQAGLDGARRVEEKRLLLSGMAELKDTRTLDALAPYLEDEELRSEAGSAMIAAARGTLPKGWTEAQHALELVLASVTEDHVRQHAQDVMKEVEAFEGFITDWRVAGPYFVKGKAGHEILDTPFPPENSGARNVAWREQPVSAKSNDFWRIDLASSIGGDHRAAYLRTYVWSEHEQPIVLELGSDDGIRAWLNGEVIHTNNALRGCGAGQDKVNATLGQGRNELMLKVTNDGGGWAACARLRAPDGGAVKHIKVDAAGEAKSASRRE